MGLEQRTRLYIGVITAAALGAIALTAWLQPSDVDLGVLEWAAGIAALVFLAGRFPFRLSPQAQASVLTAPLFMAVLLLPPAVAAATSAVGILASEASLRRRPRVALFNTSVSSLAVALASLVVWAVHPALASQDLLGLLVLPAAVAGGLVLHAVNVAAVAGMVTLRKGPGFWSYWKELWITDAIQEGGLLVLGYIGAFLLVYSWWTVALLGVPVALTYYAFRRGVEEAERNVVVMQEKDALVKELESRLADLRQTQAQLVQSEKLASVGTLAAGVAHEVNNPAFAISARAEMLLNQADRHLKSPRALEYVRDIEVMARRISTIVKDLLEYSRPSSQMEYFRLSDAMDRALSLVNSLVVSRAVRIVRHYEDYEVVFGVPSKLQQVFVNLLTNALDVTPEGGSVRLSAIVRDEWVVASVKDWGIGVHDDIQARLFEPFFTTKPVG